MDKISLSYNKTLRLQNVVIKKINMEDENVRNALDNEITKMNTFCVSHGTKPIGPLIQWCGMELFGIWLQKCFF